MDLRKADKSDIPEIRRVVEKSYFATYKNILNDSTLNKYLEEEYSEESLVSTIESDSSFIMIAEDNEHLIGYASLSWSDSDAELENIYVLPDRQGERIGSKLLNHAIENLPDNVDSIGVGLIAENSSAEQFYKKNGFREKGVVQEDFYGEKAKCLTLLKKLS